jgi:arabinose-5-phosphate isomerase
MHKEKQLPVVTKEMPFKNAILEITDKNLGCCCVVDNKNHLIGIITDGDVRRALQKFDDIRNLKASDVMTYNPITIAPDALLGEALAKMEHRTSQINVLPVVVSDNTCIGVIRLHDIVRSEL